MYAGLSLQEKKLSWKSFSTLINLLSVLDFMGCMIILLLLYLYNTNRYLFHLSKVTENFPVMSLAIFILWSTILVKAVLFHCSMSVIGGSSCILGSYGLVDFRFFLV